MISSTASAFLTSGYLALQSVPEAMIATQQRAPVAVSGELAGSYVRDAFELVTPNHFVSQIQDGDGPGSQKATRQPTGDMNQANERAVIGKLTLWEFLHLSACVSVVLVGLGAFFTKSGERFLNKFGGC